MPDFFGPLELPSTKVDGEAAGDPLLSRLTRFLFTYMVKDEGLGAWAQVSKYAPLIKSFTHDPELDDFDEKSLPAIFLYRAETGPDVATADGFTFRQSTIHLRYVFEPATQAKMSERLPFGNAVASAVSVALSRGRTPSLILAADVSAPLNDPASAYMGSWIGNILGGNYRRIWCGKTRPMPFRPRPVQGGAKLRDFYPSTITEIFIEEVSRLGDDVGTVPLSGGLKGTLNVNDPALMWGGPVESFLFKTTLTSVSPNNGTHNGGTNVALVGTNFWAGDDLAVTFGGIKATNVAVVNGNQITCTTPARAAGVVDVVLTNGNTEVITLVGGFTFT